MVGYFVVLLLEDVVEVFRFSQNAYNKYITRQRGGRPKFEMKEDWRKRYEEDNDVQIELRRDFNFFNGV